MNKLQDPQPLPKERQLPWELETVGRIPATNGEQPTFPNSLITRVPNPTVAKPSSQDTKWGNQEGNSCLWERKDCQPMGIDLERKRQWKFYLHFWIGHYRQRSGIADSGKNSHPLLDPAFLGSHLQTLEQVEFNIQSVATKIWQVFLLILISPWLFKEITGSVLENPSE